MIASITLRNLSAMNGRGLTSLTYLGHYLLQKQPFRGVLKKRCFENMQ